MPNGEVSGWVGGACSEPIVIREALRALADGEARLVSIGPPGRDPESDPGVIIAESSCASEGIVDVLIQPQHPKPLLAVVGESPAARTLSELARVIGWRVSSDLSESADAVVVAAMGRGDEDLLESALARGIEYIGLVASSKRASVVIESLRGRGLDEESLARIRSPAGLDLGSTTQEEISVAILAELVAWRHTRTLDLDEPSEATDPVCGMTISIDGAAEKIIHAGVTYYFCCPSCRARFEESPAEYAAT